MQNAQIYAGGSEIAPYVVSTRDLLEDAKIEDTELVESSLGISEVRHAPDCFKPSDLAIPAGLKALNKSGIAPEDIDCVIYCGIERDCSEPATAHIIASTMGLRPRMCFDVANACHGFGSGLQIVSSFIKSGEIRYALVVTAELSSKVTKIVTKMFKSGALDYSAIKSHVGAFTVGDAGGAMIIGPVEEDSGRGISKFRCGAISDYHGLCSYKHEESGTVTFNMDMGRISAVTLKLCKDLIGPIYQDLNWSPDDVDLFIPHQVGARPFEKVLEIVGVTPDRSIATYPKLGNLASATLPVCYDMLEDQGRLEKGKKMLMASSGSGIVVTYLGMVL